MRVVLTGTPGTGKTTATENVATSLAVIHLNDVIEEEGFVLERDEDRETMVADVDGVRRWLGDRDDILIESHVAHKVPADRVIVLRCHPEELEARLEDRGEPASTIEENVEGEVLDIILAEAVADHGEDVVYEIDTTDKSPDEVASAIEAVIQGRREPAVGIVDFTEVL